VPGCQDLVDFLILLVWWQDLPYRDTERCSSQGSWLQLTAGL